MPSKWGDPNTQEYWNKRLAEEGLGVIGEKEYITKGKRPMTGKEKVEKNFKAAKRRNASK
jgi:hypothetical protein